MRPSIEYGVIVVWRFEDEVVPEALVLEWWEGLDHHRPKSESLIFKESLKLPELNRMSKVWFLYVSFGENGKWSVVQTRED